VDSEQTMDRKFRRLEFAFSMLVDFKIEAYDAFVLGFGIGKKF